MTRKTPLRDRFDRMMRDKPWIPKAIHYALLEAYMAGAAAHDNIIKETIESGADPEEIARVCDAMVLEIKNRHAPQFVRH